MSQLLVFSATHIDYTMLFVRRMPNAALPISVLCTQRHVALPTRVALPTFAHVQRRGFFDAWDADDERNLKAPATSAAVLSPVAGSTTSPSPLILRTLSLAEQHRRATTPGRRLHTETRILPFSARALYNVVVRALHFTPFLSLPYFSA